MSDDAESDEDRKLEPRGTPWPRAVAGLAVAAHISVALALWRAPKPIHYANDHHEEVSLSILLAQVNLLSLWLMVGYGPLIRRLGWSVCGWCGIAFILATGASLDSGVATIFALQIAVTGVPVAVLRLSRRTVIHPPTVPTSAEHFRLNARQFSVLELFAAALGVAIAAALLTRIDIAANFVPLSRSDTTQVVFAVSLPAAALTLSSIMGLRGNSWLGMQAVGAGVGLILALALQTDPHWQWNGLFEIHGAHWFVVAATLWIFQMCGYRLVRTTTLRSDGR